jgi:hypothetical protein
VLKWTQIRFIQKHKKGSNLLDTPPTFSVEHRQSIEYFPIADLHRLTQRVVIANEVLMRSPTALHGNFDEPIVVIFPNQSQSFRKDMAKRCLSRAWLASKCCDKALREANQVVGNFISVADVIAGQCPVSTLHDVQHAINDFVWSGFTRQQSGVERRDFTIFPFLVAERSEHQVKEGLID